MKLSIYMNFKIYETKLYSSKLEFLKSALEPKNIDIKRFDEILGKRKRAKSVINSLDYDLRKNISMKEKSALILEITF